MIVDLTREHVTRQGSRQHTQGLAGLAGSRVLSENHYQQVPISSTRWQTATHGALAEERKTAVAVWARLEAAEGDGC